MEKVDTKKILKLKIYHDDFPVGMTIRSYLMTLLTTVWDEQEMFSGKRPFGNSGWCYDLYIPLIKAGYVEGKIDEDGYVEECDNPTAHQIIMDCIDSI